jgi:hypothetical protein
MNLRIVLAAAARNLSVSGFSADIFSVYLELKISIKYQKNISAKDG